MEANSSTSFFTLPNTAIMVSRFRMKADLSVQSIVLGVLLISLAFNRHYISNLVVLLACIGLQLLSAWQLWQQHRLKMARTFMNWATPLVLSLPLWYLIEPWLAFALVSLLVLIYYGNTIRNTVIVLKRPRSFWDLG